MKAKFLLVLALCFALPALACCGENSDTYNDFEDAADVVTEQTEDGSQADNGTQTEPDGQTDEDGQSSETDDGNGSGDTENEDEVTTMYITINSNKLEVRLAENSSVDALVEILKQGDITYTADDYGGFEKVGDIGYTLPRNDEQITTEAGDVILYLGRNICLYYGVNSWSFTRIGKINGYTTEQLKTLLLADGGEIEVTLSLN